MNSASGHNIAYVMVCLAIGGIIGLMIGLHNDASQLQHQLIQVQHQIHSLNVLLKAKR